MQAESHMSGLFCSLLYMAFVLVAVYFAIDCITLDMVTVLPLLGVGVAPVWGDSEHPWTNAGTCLLETCQKWGCGAVKWEDVLAGAPVM